MITASMAAWKVLEVLLLLFLSLIFGAKSNTDLKNPQKFVPVLLWEPKNSKTLTNENTIALEKLENDAFDVYLQKNVAHEKPSIILFTEENISSEDFVMGESTSFQPYSKLMNLLNTSARSNFFPSVNAPLKSFTALEEKGYKKIKYSTKTDLPASGNGPIILYVNLNDVLDDESRPELLKRHDGVITDLYTKMVKSHKKVLAVYTGRYSSWTEADVHHRVRRLLEMPTVAAKGNGTMIVDNDYHVMLYTSEDPIINSTGNAAIILKKPTMTTFDERGQMQRLIVTYSEPQKITLRFRFNAKRSGYWSLGEVELMFPNSTELILSTSMITVPFNFSYHCAAQNTVFKNGSTQLILKDFQIQPYLTKKKFNNAYDCVYFFTIPILSGIFVTSLLAIIMSWGLCMILDIKTMDRFDDPKGKTISINVSE